MPTKMLVSTRREVPPARLAPYQQLWSRLREFAAETGARAWRFRSADQASIFIEFVEFDEQRDPRGNDRFRQLAEEMNEISPGTAEEWRDATAAESQNPET